MNEMRKEKLKKEAKRQFEFKFQISNIKNHISNTTSQIK
jgi:hypothetical protein